MSGLEAFRFNQPEGSPTPILSKVKGVDLAILGVHVYTHDTRVLKEARGKALPKTTEFKTASANAKEFVEDLTGVSISNDAVLHEFTRNGELGFTQSHDGQVIIGEGNIRAFTGANEAFFWRVLRSNLAHEYAHSTGQENKKVIGLLNGSNFAYTPFIGLHRYYTRYLYGRTEQPLKGSFFEEAFAGEVEAQWREKTEPGYADNGNILVSTKAFDIPVRYIDLEKGLVTQGFQRMNCMVSGIAAYCLNIMNDAIKARGGPDLFPILIEARKPQSELSAKRELIRAVKLLDNVGQPSVYGQLMSLDYSESDFLRAVKLIEAAARL